MPQLLRRAGIPAPAPTQALRAYFLQARPSAKVARHFGCSPGAFRVLCHDFRRGQLPELFAAPRPGPRTRPQKDRAQEQIIALRKRNYSIYDISAERRSAPPRCARC